MKKAKYYVYMNLHKDCFSIKHKGLVIAHEKSLLCLGSELRVSEKGRQRVIQEGVKNVHAYIVCENYLVDDGRTACAFGKYEVPLHYDPYEHDKFFRLDTGEDVESAVICHCKEGKVFIR